MTTKAFIYKSLTSSKGSISLAPKMYVPRGQLSCNRACTIRGVSKSEVKGRHFLSFFCCCCCYRELRRLTVIVCTSTTFVLFGLLWFCFSLTVVPKAAETPD